MSFRDDDPFLRSKFKERLQGKTSNELMDEIQKEFESANKNWFQDRNKPTSSASRRIFNKEGFPFDESDRKFAGDGVKSHLEDLAKKHPDLARNLQCPPWGGATDKWNEAYVVPIEVERSMADSGGDSAGAVPGEDTETAPKRFTSSIEITPVNPDAGDSVRSENNVSNDSQKMTPPNSCQRPSADEPSSTSSPSTQPTNSRPHVRHIPIYVEDRNELVMPRATSDEPTVVPPKRVAKEEQQHRPPRQQSPRHYTQQQRQQQQQPRQHPPQQPEQQQPRQQQTQQNNTTAPQANAEPPSQPPRKNDPRSVINAVNEEVENLTKDVQSFKGTRKDKLYLYLDEMLTRNLIKLDTVEVEGQDELRLLRKQVIKNIQKAISILEENAGGDESTQSENQTGDDAQVDQEMKEVTEEKPKEVTNEITEVIDEKTERNDKQEIADEKGGEQRMEVDQVSDKQK